MYFTALFHRQGATTELGRKLYEAYEYRVIKPLDGFAALGGDGYFLLTDAVDPGPRHRRRQGGPGPGHDQRFRRSPGS